MDDGRVSIGVQRYFFCVSVMQPPCPHLRTWQAWVRSLEPIAKNLHGNTVSPTGCALRHPHIRLLTVARFPLAPESVVGIAGIQPGPDLHRMSRRSLLADSSLTLRVTSASFDKAPSQDLLFSVFQQLSPLQSPIASAVISLSDVPAVQTSSPDSFPVHAIQATLTGHTSQVSTPIVWQIYDARTCNSTGHATSTSSNFCPGGALLWNTTMMPGDSAVINSTLLHRNITARTTFSAPLGDPGHGTSGLYGVIMVTDIAGALASTRIQGTTHPDLPDTQAALTVVPL